MASAAVLRVVDAGGVPPIASQSLWHGITSAMRPGDPPTLSLCRPAAPYVSIGRHRDLAELDLERLDRLGVPVFRRAIGGGPVWIDADQLFFQLTVPAADAAARVDLLYRRALAPAIDAFRRLGADAELRGGNDIAAGDRRLSGTGAGRLGGGVTVVGNVIFRFPHRRMAEALALPGRRLRAECVRLMRRHVASLAAEGLGDVTPGAAGRALIAAYAEGLGARPVAGRLSAREEAAIRAWEARFVDETWHRGGTATAANDRRARKVKISAGVWAYEAADGALVAGLAAAGGRIERGWIVAERLNGVARPMAGALAGCRLDAAAVAARLRPYAAPGRAVAALLEPGLEAP